MLPGWRASVSPTDSLKEWWEKLSATDQTTATSITLTYSSDEQDNTPPLDDLQIDHISTFASDDLGVNGASGASATAIAMGAAPSVNQLFSGAASAGSNLTVDASEQLLSASHRKKSLI